MMAPFTLGLSGCGGGLETSRDMSLLALAERAEALGFESIWINEEHFQGGTDPREGRTCLSPLILAAAMAARTRVIRIGFSVLVLPLHQPLRLAEEIATLDVLSGGRIDLGISRGANPKYAAAFGFAPEDIASRFDICLDTMLRAWRDPEITLAGESYAVAPKPVQSPHPPIYMGTYTPETAAWAARQGYRLICHGISSMAALRPVIAAFAQAGGDVSSLPLGRFVYVGDSDKTARQEIWQTILDLTRRLRDNGLHRRPNIITLDELDPEVFLETMVICGSPDTCAARIAAIADEFGIRRVNALGAFFGHLPEPLLLRSLNLIATEVRPRLVARYAGTAGTGAAVLPVDKSRP